MNNLAKPFTSRLTGDSFNTVALHRAQILFICLALACAGSIRAQDAATQAPATTAAERTTAADTRGAITGRVVGEDGRPLSDAVVYLSRVYSRVAGAPLTATTDSEGRFQITGLDSGLFTISATLPGYTVPDMTSSSGETNYYRLGDNANLTLVKGGVITGTVRDSNNEPVVAVAVRAVRVRDAMGRTPSGRVQGFSGFLPERMTDDRGIYRIYGLPPGTYLISSGGSQRLFGAFNAYEGDAPTFFPSSTRDTAAEVVVRGGEEATNIDIRYRGERGHTVSGTIAGMTDTNLRAGVSITIRQISSGGFEGATFVMPGATKPGFSFSGMSDGEYEVAAQQFNGTNGSTASLPKKVTVKGADVTGVEIALLPLASISGRVQLEAPPKEKCAAQGRGATLLETLINARRDEKKKAADTAPLPFFYNGGGVPTDQGEFTIRNLMPGAYRLTTRLADETWYVRSISLQGATPAAATATPQGTVPAKPAQAKSVVAATAGAVSLKAGERLMNVTVQIAQDAAALRGRVTSATAEGAEGAQPPLNLKVYLVPLDKARAEDTLRYSEAALDAAGSFEFKNLAPGRYWIIAGAAKESEAGEQSTRPLFWDADERARLRREAEAANTIVELQPCGRVTDYVLRYGAAK
jgi:hypothetical protein